MYGRMQVRKSAASRWIPAFYLVLLAYLVVHWLVFAYARDFHQRWLRGENGFVEETTFIAFAAAVVVAARLFKFRAKMPKLVRWYFAGVLLFCFMCAGEEVSWGQWIFGFSTPESVAETNEQKEFNLHNVGWVHFHPQDVASLCINSFGIFLPVFLYVCERRGGKPWPPIAAPLSLTPMFIFSNYIGPLHKLTRSMLAPDVFNVVRSDSREIAELFWGLCMFAGICSLYAAWKRQPEPTTST